MQIETLDDLVEEICDIAGIYGDPRCEYRDNDIHHVDTCRCRVNFAPDLADRLRRALVNEQKLASIALYSNNAATSAGR